MAYLAVADCSVAICALKNLVTYVHGQGNDSVITTFTDKAMAMILAGASHFHLNFNFTFQWLE